MRRRIRKRKIFNELLLVVHPNWLEKWLEYVRGQPEHVIRTSSYVAKKPVLVERGTKRLVSDIMDWKRYRKAMFDRYGRAIIDASKREDVIVAFLLTPEEYKEYRKAVRSKIKRRKLSAAARLTLFARKHLKERLFVLAAPELVRVYDIINNLYSRVTHKGIRFSENLVIRGIGEMSNRCVARAVKEAQIIFGAKEAYVDKVYCGDVLKGVHPRRIRKHIVHSPKTYRRLAKK